MFHNLGGEWFNLEIAISILQKQIRNIRNYVYYAF